MKFGFAVVMVAFSAALMGCGGSSDIELRPVSGVLKFESGDPIAGATVFFMPEAGGSGSSAVTGDDGSFELRTGTGQLGAEVGKHKIIVTKQSAGGAMDFNNPESMQNFAAQRGGTGGGRTSEPEGTRKKSDATIPEIYTDTEKTPLKYDVTSGGDHGNIQLTVAG